MAVFIGTRARDTLAGTAAKDTLYGDEGDDLLSGLGGADILSGDEGDDTLVGGLGADVLHGGAGSDCFRYLSFAELGRGLATGFERIVDFGAADRLDLSAVAGRSFIGEAEFTGVAGEVRVDPGSRTAADTWLEVDIDGDGEADARLLLDGRFHLAELGGAGSGILVRAADLVRQGGAAADTLAGGAGEDRLGGGAGNDLLSGGGARDLLDGGAGNDTLVGGLGADAMTGGAGNDLFRFGGLEEMTARSFAGTSESDSITDFAAGDRLDLSAIGGLRFVGDAAFSHRPGELQFAAGVLAVDTDGDGRGDYRLALDGAHGLAETAKGSGVLVLARDLVRFGGGAAETIAGGAGWDWLEAGAGNDSLWGNGGDDNISGGDGDDFIFGGTGRDLLVGGAGSDVFRYTSLWEIPRAVYGLANERITDFAAGDRLDFRGIAGLGFIGSAGFTGAANQMRCDAAGEAPITTLQIDTDGDREADLTLELEGRVPLEETAPGSRVLRLEQGKAVAGTAGADSLAGTLGDDTIEGFGGDDRLNGGGGADVLVGGAGADTLTGGQGADRFVFRPGDAGVGAARDVVTEFTAGSDRIDLSRIDADAALAGDQAFTFIGANFAFFPGSPGQLRYWDYALLGDVDGDGVADLEIALPYPVDAADLVL